MVEVDPCVITDKLITMHRGNVSHRRRLVTSQVFAKNTRLQRLSAGNVLGIRLAIWNSEYPWLQSTQGSDY